METREISLNNGQIAIVDADIDDFTASLNWCACWNPGKTTTYAMAHIKGKSISLHRLVMQAEKSQVVDHINRNGLDCRRENLRVVTQSQNRACSRKNAHRAGRKVSSKFKGVTKRPSGWVAAITSNYKVHYLGHFGSEEDAARAYDAAAKEYFGEFAIPNFPRADGAPAEATDGPPVG